MEDVAPGAEPVAGEGALDDGFDGAAFGEAVLGGVDELG